MEARARRSGWTTTLLVAGLSAACNHPQSAPSGLAADSATAPPPAASAAANDPEAPYRCARDEDCMATCRFGAVSRAWWSAYDGGAADRGCEDGCAGKGLVARCDHAVCATYDTAFGGNKRVDDCTRRPPPR